MTKLNLVTTCKSEELVKEYLENNVSDVLAEKINKGVHITKDNQELINKKTLQSFMEFAKNEAKKTVDKNATYACIENETVYGWAIHYFEEDSIEGNLFTLEGEEYKPKVKIPKRTEKTVNKQNTTHKVENKQQDMFDLMFADTNETIENIVEEPIENIKQDIEQEENTGIELKEMYYGDSDEIPANDEDKIQRLIDVFGDSLIIRRA